MREVAGEGEDEGHDVSRDMVVVDLAEIRHDNGVGDELGVVVAGRRCRLRSLEPA